MIQHIIVLKLFIYNVHFIYTKIKHQTRSLADDLDDLPATAEQLSDFPKKENWKIFAKVSGGDGRGNDFIEKYVVFI